MADFGGCLFLLVSDKCHGKIELIGDGLLASWYLKGDVAKVFFYFFWYLAGNKKSQGFTVNFVFLSLSFSYKGNIREGFLFFVIFN